jgi:hypothetical protein
MDPNVFVPSCLGAHLIYQLFTLTGLNRLKHDGLVSHLWAGSAFGVGDSFPAQGIIETCYFFKLQLNISFFVILSWTFELLFISRMLCCPLKRGLSLDPCGPGFLSV